jgi:hypothetical protein
MSVFDKSLRRKKTKRKATAMKTTMRMAKTTTATRCERAL